MSVQDKMTAIADAIRGKTGGTNLLTLDEMATEIAGITIGSDETRESYVKAESLAVANQIASSGGTFKMVFVTDLHNMDDVPRLEHANQAIQALCRVTDIDCVVFGGDYIRNWTGITKEEAVEDIEQCREKFKNQIVPTYWLRGNHDTNGYVGERIPKEEAYNLIANSNVDNGAVINAADPYGNYGYVDFADKKVRLVLVNTSDNDFMGLKTVEDATYTADHINAHNVSATQLQWIADTALNFTESGWNVIFVSHLPLYWSTGSSPSWYNSHTYTDDDGNTYTCNLSNMGNMIADYINKESCTITLNGETATWDFSSLSYYATIANGINGHRHAFWVDTDELVNYISVGNACEGGKESADGYTYTKTDNTADDTTFDIIDFDFSNQWASCWNYGAGYNRVVPFRYVAEAVSVTGVSLSATSGTIQVGNSVTLVATVEPATAINRNVTWSSDDEDVATVENGVVTAVATGDAVITVTTEDGGFTATYTLAVEAKPINNLLDTIGYHDGYRLSTSTGNLTSYAGRVTTGYIQATSNDVIRIKGLTFPDSGDGTCSICIYSATDNSFISSTYLYIGAEWPGYAFAFDDDLLTITINSTNSDVVVRVCGGATTGADCIVTVNEEIT